MTSPTGFKCKFDPSLLDWGVSVLTCSQNTSYQSVPSSIDFEAAKFSFLFIEFVNDISQIDFLHLFQINLTSSGCFKYKLVPPWKCSRFLEVFNPDKHKLYKTVPPSSCVKTLKFVLFVF
jgi:hypothetical protein